MIKCIYCHQEIKGNGIIIGCDGDFVCNEDCKKGFHAEMDRICNMTDRQFNAWMHGND